MSDVTPGQLRAVAPDIARGFMLLLIAVANVPMYLWGREVSGMSMHPDDGSHLDFVLRAVTAVFVDARIYPMFAFLFGYGMVQFLLTRWRRGVPQASISRMLLRRHLWLLAFGAVHAVLLFEGDILGAYGLSGLILAAIFLWRPDRGMRVTAWVLGGLLLGGTVLIFVSSLLLDTFITSEMLNAGVAGSGGGTPLDESFSSVATMNYGLSMLLRFVAWLFVTPVSVLTLTVPLCMLLGMLAARHGWLEGVTTRVSLRVVAAFGIGISVASGLPGALSDLGVLPMGEMAATGWVLLSQSLGMFGGIGYVALFAIVAQQLMRPLQGVWVAVAAVGKRSLTFYLLQSLIYAPLLSNWGFGLGSQLNTAGVYALAVCVWGVSLLLAVLLERRGSRGPAEVLLRRLTYGKYDAPAPLVADQPFGVDSQIR
ncbi:MAG: DUF418 domain-containing protein [Leucobacter sp.]